MELPERAKQHISETASYKIFINKIPNHWIIRDINERDYGIDCYIELVNNKSQVTGNLISIQLKSQDKIEWTKGDPNKWTLSGIKIATTNYWFNFAVPVFILVVDISTGEVFFKSVRKHIVENYITYRKQTVFSYTIDRQQNLNTVDGLGEFLLQYHKDKARTEFENHVISFLANYTQYEDFYVENTGRDLFLPVEIDRLLVARNFYNNMHFLYRYLGLSWDLETFAKYEEISQKRFGQHYELYEEQLDEIVTKLHSKMLPLLLLLKEMITEREREYWLVTDIKLYNYVNNISDDGKFPDWY